MPLIKSKTKKAFSKNVSTEVKSLKAKGVPAKKAVKQAVAISYSVKKAASAKKGKK